jgi:GH24 family phage-related lysozyme (muramidase)
MAYSGVGGVGLEHHYYGHFLLDEVPFMNSALEHLEAQLDAEEGDRNLIYDDATGKTFKKGDTLKGNLSAGTGLNLMIPFAPAELKFMEDYRIGAGMLLIQAYAWYTIQDPVRQVALADIAYNIGIGGLLHWINFLAAMDRKDYPAAVAEIRSNALWISQVGLIRSGRLEAMIETGNWPSDIVVPGASS